jgi:hypothetical protein
MQQFVNAAACKLSRRLFLSSDPTRLPGGLEFLTARRNYHL